MLLSLILLPLAGAFAAYLAGRRSDAVRDALLRICTILEFLLAVLVFTGSGDLSASVPAFCGMGMHLRADGFRSLYVLAASFLWMMTSQFSKEYFAHYRNKNRYCFFNLLTLSATVGMFLSDDLYTAFIFFEVMSMASYPWVAHDETPDAMRAAATYLGISVLGGMVTLMGLFMLYRAVGTLSFDTLRGAAGNSAVTVPAVLALFGFAVKAGAFPVHVWLPKAHPVAPAPASALLSGILTKTGVFGILVISMNLFSGNAVFGNILLWIALATMLLGAVLGVFSTNLKRTLACSSMSQIGYILTGVASSVLLGHHGSLAAAGAVTHMVNHSLLKLVLFMCAGCVYMNLHQLELNDIRGFGRGKPLLNVCFALGALGLAGVPLFNGYISKTMIHEGLVELGGVYRPQEIVFLFAAGLTTAYMLKLYVALFILKNPNPDVQAKFDAMNHRYMTVRSSLSILIPAILIPVFGILPSQTLLKAAEMSASFLNREPAEAISFFSLTNLRGGAITLIIGALVYIFIVCRWMRKDNNYVNRWPERLDLENSFYRPVLCRGLPTALCGVCSVLDGILDSRPVRVWLASAAVALLRFADEFIDHVALFIRELFFSTRADMHRSRSNSPLIHLASLCADSLYNVLHRLSPRRADEKTITDMRYGTFVTNAVSFGMLLCALAVVAAIIYVFSRI